MPEWNLNGLIDLTSGLLVANIGHDRPEIIQAISRARGYAAWYAPTRHRLEAYKTLNSILPGYKYILLNSGSEAIECALQVASKYHIVPRFGCYWGSTMMARELAMHNIYAGIQTAHFTQAFIGRTCSWLSDESIIYMKEQQSKGDIIVFDEIQAGFGRTGKWWGFQHYDIEPDIVVGGKAAAGGVPFAFLAGRDWLLDADPMADYISTFSGNPFGCLAFCETVRIIKDERLVMRALYNGKNIDAIFRDSDFPCGVTFQGHGMAWAILVGSRDKATAIVKRCLKKKVLILDTGQGGIKIAPPLTISDSDLIHGLEIAIDAVKEELA